MLRWFLIYLQPTAYSFGPHSDREALAATALAFHVRIAESESLVQALLDEIDLGALEKVEAFAVHDDLDALILVDEIVRADFIGIVHDVHEAGTAGFLHAETQPETMASATEEGPDAIGSSRSERDRHEKSTELLSN